MEIYDPVPRARTLYEKMGFVTLSENAMVLDLSTRPVPNADGSGSWRIEDTAMYRGFRFIDFRKKTDVELLDDFQRNIKERLLNNDLIQVFFKFEENKSLGKPFYPRIEELLNREDEIIKEVIKEVEGMGERRIAAEGREILEDFNNMPVNAEAEKVHTWTEFVGQPTMGEYDLTQIFAHSIDLARNWLGLLELEDSYKYIAKMEKGFRENFRKGYVVLRAIEIESKTNTEKYETESDITLDDTTFKVLDGLVIESKLGAEYEIEYDPETYRADIFRSKDWEWAGYGILYLQDEGRELFINNIKLKEQGMGLFLEFLRVIANLLPKGFRTKQVVGEEGSLAYLDNLYKKYGTNENSELLNYDPHANLIGHAYFKSGLRKQKITVEHSKKGEYFFVLTAWKEEAIVNKVFSNIKVSGFQATETFPGNQSFSSVLSLDALALIEQSI